MWPSRYTHEIFLSYAVEDRPVVTAVREGLLSRGLSVWYAKEDIPPGRNLEKTISVAMSKCRFAVAIVSPAYVAGVWTLWEYGVFRDRDARGQRTILQVLLNITIEELTNTGIMTDKWSIKYEDNTDEIAERIYCEVRNRRTVGFKEWFDEHVHALRIWLMVFSLVGALVFAGLYYCWQRPCGLIKPMLEAHLREVQQRIVHEQELLMMSSDLNHASVGELQEIYNRYIDLHTRFSNSYELLGDGEKIVSRINVKRALRNDPATWTPSNAYDLTNPEMYLSSAPAGVQVSRATYMLVNTAPLRYEIVDRGLIEDGHYEIQVMFEENIRFIAVDLTVPSSLDISKRYHVRIRGFEPDQRYVFVKNGSGWTLSRDED